MTTWSGRNYRNYFTSFATRLGRSYRQPLGLWIGFFNHNCIAIDVVEEKSVDYFRWRNALYYLAAFLTVTAIFYYANQWQLIVLTIVISIISLWLLRPLFKQVWQAVGRSKGGK